MKRNTYLAFVSVVWMLAVVAVLPAAAAAEWCPRTIGFWKNHTEIWPTDSLTIGGVEYDAAGLLAFLTYNGPDASSKLAKQLVATKLNIERGGDTSIQPVIDAADAFLASYPPGSRPKGQAGREANSLKDELDAYNNHLGGTCSDGDLLGDIGDRIWVDANGDGIQDLDEAGIDGVTVYLFDGAGNLIASTVTSNDGTYLFSGLKAGDYKVVVDASTLPEGFEPTYDYDGIGTPDEASLSLLKGALNDDIDFGYRPGCNPYLVYGVHDQGLDDSQLFTLDIMTGEANALGPLRPGQDLESVALHPIDGRLFTTAARLGDFYEVDKETGALTLIGNTGSRKFREISALSFAPDGVLWGFQKAIGLVTIDIDTATVTRQWRVPLNDPVILAQWDAIAWNPEGTVIYGSQRSNLYRWTAATRTVERLCTNLPDKTEALEFDNEGNLVGGWHNESVDTLRLFTIDTDTCATVDDEFPIPFNDIESLGFEVCP